MVTATTTPAVGYARRSTDMQERSIPDQQAFVERWAKAHGYHILRWYIDDAISGTSVKDRADFERMIRDAEAGADFRAILCYDISRFSRGGTNETGYYLHRLRLASVEGIFVAEGIPDGDEGELLQGVKSWQARQYSVKLSRDCIRGQHSTVTVRHSAMGGKAPYGYDRQYLTHDGKVLRTIRSLPDGRREEFGPNRQHFRYIEADQSLGKKVKSDIARLVPGDPEQVATVRTIFEMCANGYGFRSIVIELNRRGIRGPLNDFWNREAIKAILRNPCYRGALAWNRRTFGKIHGVAPDGTARPKKVKEGTRNPQDRWIVIENVHEPLVSRELFEQAQAAMRRRKGQGGLARPTKRYLLSGLVKCLHCGFNFHGAVVKNNAGEIRYYTDGGYRARGVSVCRSTSLPAPTLDQWVVDKVREVIVTDRKATTEIIRRFVKAATAPKDQPDTSEDERQLLAVTKRIKSTLGLLDDPDLADVAELKQTLVDLKHKRETLEARLAEVRSATAATPDAGEVQAWAERRLGELARALAGKEPQETLRRHVQSCVSRIEIDPNARRGVLYLPKDATALLEIEHIRRGRQESSIHS